MSKLVEVNLNGSSMGLMDAEKAKLLQIIERKDEIEVRLNKESVARNAEIRSLKEQLENANTNYEGLKSESNKQMVKYTELFRSHEALKQDFNALVDASDRDMRAYISILRGWKLFSVFLGVFILVLLIVLILVI